MLSTGVDIPALEFIVFLRPVKSRIQSAIQQVANLRYVCGGNQNANLYLDSERQIWEASGD